MHTNILPFDKISKNDVLLVGGKGASIGEMTQFGIPVPPGFVITTKAYEVSTQKEIPKDIEQDILHAFDLLKTERVAVRSSATAEDSRGASWAGQLESYLNVTKNELLDAVKKCWISINSTRAKAYAKEQNVPSLRVAVVVQKMVDSDVSGVMFTVNPVTNNQEEMMIESGYGLGELIVQGMITPDNFIVDKKKFEIKNKTLGSQKIMLTYKNKKNQEVPVPRALKNKSTLSEGQVQEVAKLGKQIESHYQFPQDIEWAIEKGKIYIVQSRPITTLMQKNEVVSFRKTYSRDTSLIIQELFYYALSVGVSEYFGKENPNVPLIITHINKGVTEVWENIAASEWFSKALLTKNQENPHFIAERLHEYELQLTSIAMLWKQDYLATTKELKDAIELIKFAQVNWCLIYFSALDERTPKKSRDIAQKMREADVFNDTNDILIRKSLQKIYPKLGSYEALVVMSEIMRPPSQTELLRRNDNFVMVPGKTYSTVSLSTYIKANPTMALTVEEDNTNATEEIIRGQGVYPGVVVGKVRKLMLKGHIGLMQEGEILVAPMTTPAYLPAMRKALAFITDEGGVTCHAAIVAREMKTPCIVGTKIATQILHDGNVIEVDAENGLIRILKGKIQTPEFFNHCVQTIVRPTTLQRDEIVCYLSNAILPIETVSIPVDGNARASYLEKQKAIELFQNVLDRVNTSTKLSAHLDDYQHLIKQVALLKKFIDKNPTQYKTIFTKYFQFLDQLSLFIYVSVAIDKILEPAFKTEIKEKYPNNVDEILEIIGTPNQLHDYQKYRIALCSIVLTYKKDSSMLRDEISKLAHQYNYINEYSFIEKLLTPADVRSEFDTATIDAAKAEIKAILGSLEKDSFYKRKLSKLIPDKRLFNNALTIKEYAWLRTDRIDRLKEIQVSLRKVYAGLAINFANKDSKPWTISHVVSLLNDEIMDYINFDKIPNFNEAKGRMAGQYLYYFTQGKAVVEMNPEIVSNARTIITKSVKASEGSLIAAGASAYKGVVKGKVVKIYGMEDLKRIVPGSILVARVTMPKYTAAMKNAVGIITSEGGITSHAAIIARELKKPCLVGSENCMEVLKEGDLILLDSIHQVVTYCS